MKHEWRKSEKEFYLPKTKPELKEVPAFKFFMIEGKGNPNDVFFANYVDVLYSLSYAVKMSPKAGIAPEGYYDYTVYPLEGIWDISENAKSLPEGNVDKKSFEFTLMIRQPDFVTQAFAEEILERTKAKKPNELLDKVKFALLEDGKCVQMIHIGSYDTEDASFRMMEDFCLEQNLSRVSQKHREIYLSDPRKVSSDKLKTVLRFNVE